MLEQENERPLIGITMGDPAGIGPEIVLKALVDPRVYAFCRPVVLGDRETLISAVTEETVGARLETIGSPAEALGHCGVIDLMAVSNLEKGTVLHGKPVLQGGKAMVDYILEAVDLARRGEIDAMVTCPISKTLMHQAGYAYEGHTRLIAERTGSENYVMMLAGSRLRVTLATIHCGLKEVAPLLDAGKVYRTIHVTAMALRQDLGIVSPRLAVAALNPHAGEGGLFGSEEEEMILPAVSRARDEGMDVRGPLPGDTVFWKAANGQFDAVVAMYHDQGLIPLKLLHFSDAVNITLGLPIVRTSVDHGTAYDIAGTGKADPSSLKAAIRMAARIAANRRRRF
jgi:4-hydroxythreonine-4-phosphate dehydrogenase